MKTKSACLGLYTDFCQVLIDFFLSKEGLGEGQALKSKPPVSALNNKKNFEAEFKERNDVRNSKSILAGGLQDLKKIW